MTHIKKFQDGLNMISDALKFADFYCPCNRSYNSHSLVVSKELGTPNDPFAAYIACDECGKKKYLSWKK